MKELRSLIALAQADDLDAYGAIVRRFQDMAVGYAYSVLKDVKNGKGQSSKTSTVKR